MKHQLGTLIWMLKVFILIFLEIYLILGKAIEKLDKEGKFNKLNKRTE